MNNNQFLNTKIYTTDRSLAKKYATVCGVKKVYDENVEPNWVVGFGFNARNQGLGVVTAFERGSGIDDGDFQGISYREVSSDEVITAYKAMSK